MRKRILFTALSICTSAVTWALEPCVLLPEPGLKFTHALVGSKNGGSLETVVLPHRKVAGFELLPLVEESGEISFIACDKNGVRLVAAQKPGMIEPELLEVPQYLVPGPLVRGTTVDSTETLKLRLSLDHPTDSVGHFRASEPPKHSLKKNTIMETDAVVHLNDGTTYEDCVHVRAERRLDLPVRYVDVFGGSKGSQVGLDVRIQTMDQWFAPKHGSVRTIFSETSSLEQLTTKVRAKEPQRKIIVEIQLTKVERSAVAD